MGLIKKNESGETVLLNSHHLFGRNKHSTNTFIPDSDVTRSHATIFWKCRDWYIRDHSRNGTLVNSKYVHNSTVKLSLGDKIQFAKNESTKWILKDISNPKSYLKSLTYKNKTLLLATGLSLPNDENPELSVYFDKDNKWIAELEGRTFSLEHGTIFHFNNEEWMFIENIGMDETLDHGHVINQAYFQFNLSADEERINVKIVTTDLKMDLGERVHNYLLLVLARKKLNDIQAGYVYSDQGWIDVEELMENMGREFRKEIDEYILNLQIHRIRKQLIELEPYGYLFSNIIERRRGKIRFAHKFFQLFKEEQLVGEIIPT